MMHALAAWAGRRWINRVSIGAVVSVAALAWLGYRAATEWQRSAELAAQRNADAAADLLFTAITRDMRGVQATVLPALQVRGTTTDGLLDVNAVASAFARYPYPEVFFAAHMDGSGAHLTFYTRADRTPAYLPAKTLPTPFPVVTVADPELSDALLARIAADFNERKTVSAFNRALDDVHCQVVALLSYADPARTRYADLVGFIVNLDWAREQYYPDLTAQVRRIRATDAGLRLAVLDSTGVVRAGDRSADGTWPSSARKFPLLFFDPALTDLAPAPDLGIEWWTGRATVAADSTVLAARTGARVTLVIASISALVLAAGLALGAGAAAERARLIEMRADFIAAVTHDLKTPIATIRAITESSLRRADITPKTRREYGEIVLQETKRLTRLVDNLLASANVSDVAVSYNFQPVDLDALLSASLKQFAFRLEANGFTVTVNIPEDLPLVLADPTALTLALDNLLDNAIRYSGDRPALSVGARVLNGYVELDVTDAGVGIPADEIRHVSQRFFRGRHTPGGGSGLGLAITKRIIDGHSGRLSIRSTLGLGTTVAIALPIAKETEDDSGSGG
jgi:signal transduction histidine kinase